MKLVLATNNQGKLREYKALLDIAGLCLITPAELGIAQEARETGSTFRQNALIKAREICRKSGLPSLADDSGLCVDALGGAPGVYSARYGGQEVKTDKERYELLLKNMQDKDNRNAYFACAIAIVLPDGTEQVFEGAVEGQISVQARGENGFGYDPVFYLEEFGRNMAELTPEEKDRFSHRAVAAYKTKPFLRGLIEKDE